MEGGKEAARKLKGRRVATRAREEGLRTQLSPTKISVPQFEFRDVAGERIIELAPAKSCRKFKKFRIHYRLHNSPALGNAMSDALSKKRRRDQGKSRKERKRKREESEEEFYFRRPSSLETQINAGIHETARGNRTHLGRKTRAENILENYTAERASRAGRDGERRENARVIPEIYYRPERGADLLLEFRESKWKGVDFRRLDGERPAATRN